jgi:Lrp/AsnC family transcriptional regulator for asnA, asnC and gidA
MAARQQSRVDDLDLAILRHLQSDGRKSFSIIADDLDVTVTTVSKRVKRMIRDDILLIEGFVQYHAVGFNAPAMIGVSIEPKKIEEASRKIAALPEVVVAAITTGEYDLILEVVCRDAGHLSELVISRISKVNGVKQTRTFYMLRTLKLRQAGIELLQRESKRK